MHKDFPTEALKMCEGGVFGKWGEGIGYKAFADPPYYSPLYRKGIKKTQNKPIVTTFQ